MVFIFVYFQKWFKLIIIEIHTVKVGYLNLYTSFPVFVIKLTLIVVGIMFLYQTKALHEFMFTKTVSDSW